MTQSKSDYIIEMGNFQISDNLPAPDRITHKVNFLSCGNAKVLMGIGLILCLIFVACIIMIAEAPNKKSHTTYCYREFTGNTTNKVCVKTHNRTISSCNSVGDGDDCCGEYMCVTYTMNCSFYEMYHYTYYYELGHSDYELISNTSFYPQNTNESYECVVYLGYSGLIDVQIDYLNVFFSPDVLLPIFITIATFIWTLAYAHHKEKYKH